MWKGIENSFSSETQEKSEEKLEKEIPDFKELKENYSLDVLRKYSDLKEEYGKLMANKKYKFIFFDDAAGFIENLNKIYGAEKCQTHLFYHALTGSGASANLCREKIDFENENESVEKFVEKWEKTINKLEAKS